MKNVYDTTDKNSPEYLLKQITGGRSSLLLILVFTAINLVMLLLDVDRYFLFSASVPYYLTMLGKGIDNGFVDGAWDINGTFTVTALVISVVVLAVYLVCWLLSKKKSGALIAALVLFILDTVALIIFTFTLYDNPAVNLMDFVFHAWAVASMIHAVRAGSKLKQLPPEEEIDLNELAGSIPTLGDNADHLDL